MKYETDRAILSWEEHGEGQPIVFLHGWTMNRQVETEVYEPIFSARPGWRRIYPDLPGMGSSVAKTIRNQDDVLEAMLAFLDHRLAGAPFVLCGTSLGGYLARAIAARRREQVRGLLLRVPAVIADTGKRTLPAFEPLVRNENVMAAIDPAERLAMGPMLVEAPAYVEMAQRRFRALVQPAIAGTAPWALELRADPARYGLFLRSGGGRKIFHQAGPGDRSSSGHHRRLPRRLGDHRELSARDLRCGRPGDPRLAQRIDRSARRAR
jgi:pimeloyl-ACP methyl ester carboxylesterase